MRSTLLCDYTHTSVLFAIILVFVFTVYATSSQIGSFARMHELLTAAAESNPVPGNAHGSYLTMRSKNGIIFGGAYPALCFHNPPPFFTYTHTYKPSI
jgi:urea-proton symporter